MPVTIRDVAQRSGFSTSTVSRVLTHHPGISPETRSRVLAVVEEMNYQPNVLARSLVNARTRMLCVVLPTGPFDGREKLILETISGIGQHARDRGYHVVFLHADTQATEHALDLSPTHHTVPSLRLKAPRCSKVKVSGEKSKVSKTPSKRSKTAESASPMNAKVRCRFWGVVRFPRRRLRLKVS